SRSTGEGERSGNDAGRGVTSGLAILFAATDSVCRGSRGVRRTDIGSPNEHVEGTGAGCMAEFVPSGAVFVGGGFCASRSRTEKGWGGYGARVFRSRSAAGAVPARRNFDDHEFYGAAVADAARGLCGSVAGAQRLGAGSEEPAADI